ncbi:MAG: hypothetical protein HY925_02685 [Elusimicrobia bacterium]|nr:hypothetical protein [Elusimicrobiota bacterium]
MSGFPSVAERKRFLRAAHALADLSRREILRRAGRSNPRLKADASFVTDADLAAERALREEIARRFPEHGIVGEEYPDRLPEADHRWIVDPIDGTLSFKHGIPCYGTILALHHQGRPVVGLIDHPALGIRVAAAAGLGAWKGKTRLRIRDLKASEPVHREVLSVGDRGHFVRCAAAKGYDRLRREHPQVRGYADCFGHTLVAGGSVAAMADFGLKIWDLSATKLLIEEAGGRYEVAHVCRKDGLTLYGILFGKPRAVAYLRKFFRRNHG